MLNIDKNLGVLKLDKKIIFSREKGIIDNTFSLNFQIIVENNIIINLFEIMNLINKKGYQSQSGNYSIEKINEKYILKIKESDSKYNLDELLIQLFNQIKEQINDKNNLQIDKMILIDDDTPLEIRLIIQQASLINGIEIINIIDTNKALRFYINLFKPNQDEFISIIIKYNKHIDIAIYTDDPIRKLFKSYQEIPNDLEELKDLKIGKEGFIVLEKLDKNEIFIKIKEYLSNLINNEMGNQEFKNIEKIYIFEGNNLESLNQEIFFGAFNSLNFEKTQECTALFKIIDNNEPNDNKRINEIIIENYKYNLEKKEIPILLDLLLPFKGCFYTPIIITLSGKKFSNFVIITVYFNQINYYYISLSQKYCNSLELIFYKTFPEEIFSSKNYKNIQLEENFEDNEYFKRLCLININREEINLNLIPDECIDTLNSKYKNCTIIIGEKLNILSFYNKTTYIKKSMKRNLYDYIEYANELSSRSSLKEIELCKNKLNKMYFDVKYNKAFFDNYIDKGYDNDKFDKILFYIAYGKFMLFKTIFVEETNNGEKFNYNENTVNTFIKLMKNLEKFYEKCKNLIKNDELLISKLFFSASIAIYDYLNSKEYLDLEIDLFELIDFKEKGTIYNAAYENNLELILNLNKESFLYPIFLQFNSGFKLYEDISTCMISKLTLQQIKLDLIKSLDHYGIRIFFYSEYNATTNLFTNITMYNECKNFGKKLDTNELLSSNDNNFHKRTTISFLQKHERFCHLKKIFNKNELEYLNSPRGYIDFLDNQLKILSLKNNENKGEIGETFEYFITNGQRALISKLYLFKGNSYNFQNLFRIDILLEKTNEKLINILKDIPIFPEVEELNEENDQEDIIKNDMFNTSNKYKIPKTKKDKVKDKKDIKIDKYIEEKNEIINVNTFRKYTFPINTIYKYKYNYFSHKLEIDE